MDVPRGGTDTETELTGSVPTPSGPLGVLTQIMRLNSPNRGLQ